MLPLHHQCMGHFSLYINIPGKTSDASPSAYLTFMRYSQQLNSRSSFLSLPGEILHEILRRLDCIELLKCRLVRSTNHVITMGLTLIAFAGLRFSEEDH
jgi:hypothetical protein